MRVPTEVQIRKYIRANGFTSDSFCSLLSLLEGRSSPEEIGTGRFRYYIKQAIIQTGLFEEVDGKYQWSKKRDEIIDKIMEACPICGCEKSDAVYLKSGALDSIEVKYCTNCRHAKITPPTPKEPFDDSEPYH